MGLQLTHGSEYALRAMTYLAARPAGELSSQAAVSRVQSIPDTFLAKLFQTLVHAGLIVSKPGVHGGFALRQPSSQINVAQVIQAIDGPLSLNRCVLEPQSCERSERCPMHAVWLRTQESLMEVLEKVTLADLVPGQTPGDQDVPSHLLGLGVQAPH